MALDPDQKQLSLLGTSNKKTITKIYPLSDVREWGFNIPGYSTSGSASVVMYGGSFGMNAVNAINNTINDSLGEAAQMFLARENTCFWIKVKDTDHPLWKIKFDVTLSKNDLRAKMDRWMEIMEQHVNEDKPAV